ncbi:hypothetical protein Tsubulata_012838 [Turnera subulata]|uniref:CCHC-type domain-containing protein n=1 Tax=Turnera subulata TaxID=218843 RepID=A0A9Q0FP32_9ROSI|nr:hypothetical protein Tsubulata_012838 [Turnera subulata]
MATAQIGPGWPPKPPDPQNLTATGTGGTPRLSFKDNLMNWRVGMNPYNASDGFKLSEDDIRVLGRRFSYRVIFSKIAYLWKPQGGFQVIDLDNDYFLKPGFDVRRAPTRATVWVQIPELPVEWYRQNFLGMLSAQIRKPTRIDINTLQAERGKFSRLAIEVDFTKPLLGWVEIEDRWFKVKYEDIPDFCIGCGKIGHVMEQCSGKQADLGMVLEMATRAKSENVEDVAPAAEQRQSDAPAGNSVLPQGPGGEGSANFGPWLKVARPSRQTLRQPAETRNASRVGVGSSTGKRFVNPFELGSASALLHEVHRDAMDPQSSTLRMPAPAMIF